MLPVYAGSVNGKKAAADWLFEMGMELFKKS